MGLLAGSCAQSQGARGAFWVWDGVVSDFSYGTHMNTHTHAYIYIYIYTVVHLYIHLYTQNIRENQIDMFKNLLHVLTGNLDQIKKRIDQRGKEKHGKATTTKDIRGSFKFCLFPAFFACFSLLFPILHCFIFIFCF